MMFITALKLPLSLIHRMIALCLERIIVLKLLSELNKPCCLLQEGFVVQTYSQPAENERVMNERLDCDLRLFIITTLLCQKYFKNIKLRYFSKVCSFCNFTGILKNTFNTSPVLGDFMSVWGVENKNFCIPGIIKWVELSWRTSIFKVWKSGSKGDIWDGSSTVCV